MLLIRVRAFLCALLFCGLAAGNARADDGPEAAPDFTKHVLPIFEAKCNRCHGAQRRGGKLDMRSVDSLLAGGVSGPAFKPGNSKKSLLIELIHYNEMPPKKESPRVTKEELELLRKWIDARPAQKDSASPEPTVGAPQVRQAVENSLAFLEKDGLAWESNKCASCHHGPWMMWSGYEAKRRGFLVKDESLEQVRAGMLKAYSSHPKLQPTSRDILNDLSINVIYLTFAMGAKGEPDADTAKFFDQAAAHLIEQQKEDGSWKVIIKKFDGKPVPSSKTTPPELTTTFLMAPLIDSDDVTTLWALLALNYREPAGISQEVLARSKERGLKFLSDNPPSDTLQSLVLRIMLNQRLGKSDDVQTLVKQLLAVQQDDGGWSQTRKLGSDALGTGQALVALTSAGVPTESPAIVKAWGFLIKSQKPNGSWEVMSRAYQAPEFSSYMGTAWATLGLVRTLPETNAAAVTTATQPSVK
ncbi:MAG: Ankyrin [Planctomycetaceae bacterium]|nr:Ankyrin [Planctomycetaceae bacterium]